jgi:flagellar biosynthesis protein FlhG
MEFPWEACRSGRAEGHVVTTRPELPLVFSVTSGKGGVGKTNISVNLAYCLSRMGKRTVILDADLGLANVDVLLGLTPKLNLFHLFHEGVTPTRPVPDPLWLFHPARHLGGQRDADPVHGPEAELLEAMDYLENRIDYLIVDTGAGINDNVIYFNLAARERLVILTTELHVVDRRLRPDQGHARQPCREPLPGWW